MFIRLIAVFCLITLLVPAGTQAADRQELKRQLEKIFRDDPDILLDVLREHSIEVLQIVKQGSKAEREQAMLDQWKQEIKNPLKSDTRGRIVRGNAKGDIQIVEFSDFQCPYCGRGAGTVEKLLEKYDGRVGVVFKHLPLKMHEHAEIAARMFEAAALQDEAKAWKLHDAMFADREALSKGGEEWIVEQASKIGLDVKKLKADTTSEAVAKILKADQEEAGKFDINGTPTFLVNGVTIGGSVPLTDFEKLLKLQDVL